MSAAEAFDIGDIRRLAGCFAFGSGAAVVLYGLIQLHDTTIGGSRWDFIQWHTTSFSGDIFSTFGNPNHLAGYLAIVLPLAIVLGSGTRSVVLRCVAGIFAASALVELLRTAARGAWVATLAALFVLVLAVIPELKRRPWLMAGSGLAVVGVVGAGMAVVGHRLLNEPLSQLFQSGGSSPVQQRFDIWHVALNLAAAHPLVGIGPDNFALVYPQHQSAAWVSALGPNYLVNGAHDLFMNIVADQGFVGLLLFLCLLLTVGLKTIGAQRRFLKLERAENTADTDRRQAKDNRLITGALAAAMTAYVVQALFDVQQVGLAFGFWLILGALAVAWRGAGVPHSIRLALLVSPQLVDVETEDVKMAPQGRAVGRRRRRVVIPWPAIATACALAVGVVFAAVGADGPYRADHVAWAAYADIAASSNQITPTYFTDMSQAMTLNPWEPSYPAMEGATLLQAAPRLKSRTQLISVLQQARSDYAKALSDERLSGTAADGLATANEDLAHADPHRASYYLRAARSAVKIAVADNPRDSQFTALQTKLAGMR